jgi:hypothetical protein
VRGITKFYFIDLDINTCKSLEEIRKRDKAMLRFLMAVAGIVAVLIIITLYYLS